MSYTKCLHLLEREKILLSDHINFIANGSNGNVQGGGGGARGYLCKMLGKSTPLPPLTKAFPYAYEDHASCARRHVAPPSV